MTNTAELIARLDAFIERAFGLHDGILTEVRDTLLAQEQEIERQARVIEYRQAAIARLETRAAAAEAQVRDLEEELSTDWPEWASKRNEQVKDLIAERDAIEAKTFMETRKRCAQVAENVEGRSRYDIAAAIRALRHIGREG